MKNVSDSFLSLVHSSSIGSIGLNTDIFATNIINLSIVLGLLIFFGRKVLSDLLDNRKQRILNTIQNSEELRGGAFEQLEKAGAGLRKAEIKADRYRVNGYSDIEQERSNSINSTYKTLKQSENYQNETILFEQQKAIIQIRQQVVQQALQGALGTLNNSLTKELHLRIISANIGILGEMKEIRD